MMRRVAVRTDDDRSLRDRLEADLANGRRTRFVAGSGIINDRYALLHPARDPFRQAVMQHQSFANRNSQRIRVGTQVAVDLHEHALRIDR